MSSVTSGSILFYRNLDHYYVIFIGCGVFGDSCDLLHPGGTVYPYPIGSFNSCYALVKGVL